jgi:hypothetical protein
MYAALCKLSHYWRFYHINGIIAGSKGKVNIYHIFLVNYQLKGERGDNFGVLADTHS